MELYLCWENCGSFTQGVGSFLPVKKGGRMQFYSLPIFSWQSVSEVLYYLCSIMFWQNELFFLGLAILEAQGFY